MHVKLPYGEGYKDLELSEEHILQIVTPKHYTATESEETLIQHALNHPLGSPQLKEIAQEGQRVVIVVDDYTRPCPTQLMLPHIIKELQSVGIKNSDITILIATGTHSPPDTARINKTLGKETAKSYHVISNTDPESEHIDIGQSKNGNTFLINKVYLDADLKIIVGDIEYHYFAGYGGTRKSILPGICHEDTIQENHKLMFHENSNTGILKGNILSEEMFEGLHAAGCDFCINAVLNSEHHLVGCWSGDPDLVMEQGTQLVDKLYKQHVCVESDLTIITANGSPHDINLYQATKALYTATNVTKQNGTIILLAQCPDGIGNAIYEEWLNTYKTAAETEAALKAHFIMGAHKAYYHRNATENHQVILISELEPTLVKDFLNMIPAKDLNEALSLAYQQQATNAKALIVPQGTTTHLVCRNK